MYSTYTEHDDNQNAKNSQELSKYYTNQPNSNKNNAYENFKQAKFKKDC